MLVIEESADQRRLLVKRVVASSTFSKSERLSTFLLCVSEWTLSGQADSINEQKIGTAIFGRKPQYDSGADGIVRTQASRLRQRLDLYFATEGVGEPFRIVLPRGSYVPQFVPQHVEVTPETIGPLRESKPSKYIEPAVSAEVSTKGEGPQVLPWLLCGTLALVLLAVLVQHRATMSDIRARQLPTSHPIWSRLFAGTRSTIMVPADSGLVLYSGSSKRSISLSDYARKDFQQQAPSLPTPKPEMRLDGANFRYTSIVDLQIAASLAKIASERSSNLNIRYARDLRPNDLKSVNAILSGAAEANPWVQLFEQHMNFQLVNDPQSQVFSILNRLPVSGEPAQWSSRPGDPERLVYGVVAFVPNLTDDGDVLLVEGTSMSGTEAAWDFVIDDAKLLPFLAKIREQNGRTPHFEVLLRTNNMGSSAVDTSIVAWRVSR